MSDVNYSKMMTKGLASSIESTPIEEGKIRFTTDTNQLFIDADGVRHEISDVIRGYTEAEIKSLLAPLPKLYLSSDTHKFLVYASGEWIPVGKNEWVGTKAEFDVALANGEILEDMTVYITDDYTGDGADLSIYATNEYVDGTFVAKESGKGLSSVDVTTEDTTKWNSAYSTATKLDGDASTEGSVAYRVAQIVANAPENYDTLKEIADWIENDTDGAAAMNLKITQNTNDISTLNSNKITYQKWTIAAGETRRIQVREAQGTGNLVLFSAFLTIPSYKTIFLASSGNGNNTNPGQYVVITKLLESSVVTVERVNESEKYNCFEITNNGTYDITLHANTLYGTPPVIL